MNLELNDSDARLLHEYLGRELERRLVELSRTEQRDFRHALAQDIEQLSAIHARLGELVKPGLDATT